MTTKMPPNTLVAEYCQLKCYAVTAEDHAACRAERYDVGRECSRGLLAHMRRVFYGGHRTCIAPRLLHCTHIRAENRCALPVGEPCVKPEGDPA